MTSEDKKKKERRLRRKLRHKNKTRGTEERPRLSVYRSLKHIYAQIIDDTRGHTLVSASSLNLKKINNEKKMTKEEQAKQVGKLIASLAIKKNIKKVVFDKGWYKYHGRVKSLAEGAREGGLIF